MAGEVRRHWDVGAPAFGGGVAEGGVALWQAPCAKTNIGTTVSSSSAESPNDASTGWACGVEVADVEVARSGAAVAVTPSLSDEAGAIVRWASITAADSRAVGGATGGRGAVGRGRVVLFRRRPG